MNYEEYLPYLEDSVDELLDIFQSHLLERTSHQRCLEIRNELKIYLQHFKNMKDKNPDKVIDDHVEAILYSYMLNPDLDIRDRDAHYNGVWYALWGSIHKDKISVVKEKCAKRNPSDERWTQVCLLAVDEYYEACYKPTIFETIKDKFKR